MLPVKERMQEQAPFTNPEEEAKDDAALMHQIAAGNQRAFQKLMRRHLARTVRLAQRIMGGNTLAAEDVAQEAFIRVWKHAGNWEDPGKSGAKFTTWLYRIVLNLCIDEKRKDRFANIDNLPEQADMSPDAEGGMEQKEQSKRVKAAIGELPERQRAAFVLCFYEGYSNKEAADMLGISVGAIESLLVRSRRFLREQLAEEKP